MGEQELAEMRVRANSADIYGPRDYAWLARYVLRLVAEVERLRAELRMKGDAWINGSNILLDERKRMEAENAALRGIVEDLAATPGRLTCAIGCRVNERWNKADHRPDCPVTRARALLDETQEPEKASE